MRRLPSVYTVLGRPYTVRRLGPNEKMPHDSIPDDAYGASDHYKDQAILASGLSPAQDQDTLLHEIMHSIIRTTGIRPLIGKKQEDEENIICALTPQLLHFLQTNPAVVRYLMEVVEPEVKDEVARQSSREDQFSQDSRRVPGRPSRRRYPNVAAEGHRRAGWAQPRHPPGRRQHVPLG